MQIAGFRPGIVIDYLTLDQSQFDIEDQTMDGSGLFVSSCSRRELARRRSAGRFWTRQNLLWMLGRLAGPARRSPR
jgi:hypothetical protein